MAFNLGKIAKGVALPFAAGAAKGYIAKRDELQKEFRENKRRQEQWMATSGRPAIAKDKAEQDTILSAAQRIENAGLPNADVRQLLELHGPESVMELAKLVRTYEGQGKSLSEDMMQEAFQGIDDYEPESSSIEEAVGNAFALVSSGDTFDPVDTEEMGFLERLSYNLSGDREENKLRSFLDEEYEGGLSINEARQLVTRGLPRGKEGLASFDSSVFQTGFSTEDKEYTKILKSDIEARTLQLLGENSELVLVDAALIDVAPSKVLDNIIKVKEENDDVKVAYEQALKESFERTELWDANKLAEQFFGGADYLSTLNMTLEEQLAALIENEEMTQAEKDNIQEFDTREDHANSGQRYGIVDGELVFRQPEGGGGSEEGGGNEEGGSEEGSGSEPVTPVPVEFDPETFELAVQPEPDPVIPPKPEPDYYTSGREKASSEKAREEWEEKYGKRYTDTGSKRYVSPRPTLDNNDTFLYESWMFQWGESHDPETGFPLIDEEDQ
jgi:hypothetical protein